MIQTFQEGVRVAQLVSMFEAARELVRERGRRDLSFSPPRATADRSDSRASASDELVLRVALAALSLPSQSNAHSYSDSESESASALDTKETRPTGPRARTAIELFRVSLADGETADSSAPSDDSARERERVRVVCREALIRIAAPVTRALALKSLVRMPQCLS